MKGLMKWVLIGGGVLAVLIIGAIFLIPRLVDVKQYKPMIEKLVQEQTSRSFSMGDDIKLSVFPWVGVSLSDLHFGSPKGFESKDMIALNRFEVRLKVMPLLSRQVEVSTFVVDTPRFFLEKSKSGKANWENIGPTDAGGEKKAFQTKETGKQDTAAGQANWKFSIESFLVGNFSILNGHISYVNQTTGVKKEISDFNLNLSDISFDKPIGVNLSGKFDGKPVFLEGMAGAVGKEPGKQDLNLDLTLKLMEQLSIRLKGKISQPMGAPKMAFDLEIAPFSPRKLLDGLGQPFPVNTADPTVLDKLSLTGKIEGNAQALSLSNGVLGLDDSTLTFRADAKNFDKPDLKFDLTMDRIDLDRYLPPKQVKQEGGGQKNVEQAPVVKKAGPQKPTDYGPLRKLLLDGNIQVGSLKVANVKIQDFLAHVTAKNGVIDLDPLSLNLYQGSVASKTRLDVRGSEPVTAVSLDAKGIQAGPLLKDALEKEIVEGTVMATMTLGVTGESPDRIKNSLEGKGEVKFVDGAIVGIDIANSVRKAAAGLGLGETTAQKPRTDFAELNIPFSADKGIVTISEASLMSPLIRLGARGTADLVTEAIDLRVEPKFVATLKGQGDTEARSGLLIPLLITGSFDAPKIRPDLKAMIGGQVPDGDSIKQLLNTKGSSDTDGKSVEDTAKGLLKGFFPVKKE